MKGNHGEWALVAYTLLPLPDPSLLKCGPGGSTFQAIPFQFLDDIQRETSGLGVTGTLTSRATLQVVFNVVLFIPWGIYDCAYRLADVDDLITNTLGALIGALIAPLVHSFMPQRRELRAARDQSRPVLRGGPAHQVARTFRGSDWCADG
ncbi:VanZ family protein [Arthrobacter sp. 18067]|uniref:VanZ family protein n=1 Tax=Arthrobacter sp. 18067 TaxID=2681413 RepID=UPI001357D317|nr:VanZ family protein [Arthrobacter sp. 18067]